MPCPICDKTSQEKFKPFCSDRCAMLDLGRWLDGSYSVPVVEDDDLPDEWPEDGESQRPS